MDSPALATDLSALSSSGAEAADETSPGDSTSRIASAHLLLGGLTLASFLGSGTYMLFHDPPLRALALGPHVMFTSRHIYILAAALVHLVLGAYVAPAATRGTKLIQYVGSSLLLAASPLLALAFVYEPVAGRQPTAFSRLGLYSLFVGSILHVAAGLRARQSR